MRRVMTVVNALALLLALAATARAQAATPMAHSYDNPDEHARAFTSGNPHGWTVGGLHLDIAGGSFHVGGAGGYVSNNGSSAAFFRVHAQFAVASRAPYRLHRLKG